MDLQETPGWPLAPGTTLGKYRIVRFLGEGGMGAVYEGLHVEMGKRVAIKTISPALAAVPEARARFVLEAQLTSRVRHPHSVDDTDICMESEQAFLVMEYLEGEDLARHLRHHGALPVEEIVDIALPILAAVGAAHDEGIVHRDLKPQNIFLAEAPGGVIHPKVLDFGISKAPAHSPIKTSGVVLGSPIYFAPEQVADPRSFSPASDQYALGVILYECATGRLPYEGSNLAEIFQAIVQGSFPAPRTSRAELPEGFERIITRAMSLTPGDRYANLRQMGQALLEFASTKTGLLWRDQFTPPATEAPLATGSPSPVPVTDQTPGPPAVPLADTVSMPGPRPPAELPAAQPPAGWIPPTRLPWPSAHYALRVPRRFPALRWAAGAGALCAAAWLVGFMMRGSVQVPREIPATEAPAAAPPAVGTAAPPAVGTAAPPAAQTTAPARAETDAASEPAPTVRPPRRARGQTAAHRPRFGPNKAPLID